MRLSRGFLGLCVGLLVLTGCDGTDFGLPTGASDRSEYVDTLWFGAWIAALVVGVFTWGLIGWAVIRYRRRSEDETPPQVRYNLPIEVLYTVAPVIVVAVLFFHTVEVQEQVLDDDQEAEHLIKVVGEKWAWTFIYTDEDAAGGESVYDVGTPSEPTDLWLPVDEVVQFDLTSADVIHAFWVPAFTYKEDVIPGRTNTFTMTPITEGDYAGRCSELCGLYHSRMLFTVRVVSRADYDAHLQDLADVGQVGEPTGPEGTRTIAGDESEGDAE